MKIVNLCLLALCCIVSACTKENATPTETLIETIDSTSSMNLKGKFENGPFGSVTGMAFITISGNQKSLVLENISSSNGPDLHVYLSKEIQPINFIDLGKLKSINGTHVYPIDININIQDFKFALVHCQQYNHLFGSAKVQ